MNKVCWRAPRNRWKDDRCRRGPRRAKSLSPCGSSPSPNRSTHVCVDDLRLTAQCAASFKRRTSPQLGAALATLSVACALAQAVLRSKPDLSSARRTCAREPAAATPASAQGEARLTTLPNGRSHQEATEDCEERKAAASKV